MNRFTGCLLQLAALVFAVMLWCGFIYASNLLGVAVFG